MADKIIGIVDETLRMADTDHCSKRGTVAGCDTIARGGHCSADAYSVCWLAGLFSRTVHGWMVWLDH